MIYHLRCDLYKFQASKRDETRYFNRRGSKRASNLRSHSFRSSTFCLLNAMSISERSSIFNGANGIMCVVMFEKYSFASSFVLVPNPFVTSEVKCKIC